MESLAGMPQLKKKTLGFDTSCYTTSIAVVEDGKVLWDGRLPIIVPPGSIGLRQSDILFQHIKNLTQLMESIQDSFLLKGLHAVGYSKAPRSQDGSYMPVFLAGQNMATAAAVTAGVPLCAYSHQDGHMAAVQLGKPLADHLLALHLSGGTSEAVRAERRGSGYEVSLVGATLDISFGQLIDRLGVHCGLDFPSGSAMDRLASEASTRVDLIPLKPKITNGRFNLSGYENKLKALHDSKKLPDSELFRSLFIGIGQTLLAWLDDMALPDEPIWLAGGVSANQIVREVMLSADRPYRSQLHFGEPVYSTDNAVGIALLAAAE